MRRETLRRSGRALLATTAVFALGVLLLAMVTTQESAVSLLALAAFIAWPLGSLFAERAGLMGLAWGLLALFALQAFWFGFSWGGLLLYGLPVYAAGLFCLRWARRGAASTV